MTVKGVRQTAVFLAAGSRDCSSKTLLDVHSASCSDADLPPWKAYTRPSA